MKKRISIILLASAICISCLAGCGSTSPSGTNADQASDSGSDEIINEGVDTEVEVLGYSEYSGIDKGYFLSEGDRVAVISPSALPSREQVDATINGLKEWGYVPVEGKYVCPEVRTVEECLEDLEWALNDPDIKAIFCVRGGYASTEVLDIMSLETIAASKKLIIGYSDISAYHSAWTVSGLPSVHASMSAAFTDLSEECVEVEKHIIKGEIPAYKVAGSEYDKQGTAEGVLIGGNLTIFRCGLNTDYDSSLLDQPYILFLEDVGSDYLSAHASLTSLRNRGVLENAAGIILGEWTDFYTGGTDYTGTSRGGQFTSVADMIYRQFLKDLDIPVAFGFPAGHGENNYPLLMGENLRLTVEEDGYTLEWP